MKKGIKIILTIAGCLVGLAIIGSIASPDQPTTSSSTSSTPPDPAPHAKKSKGLIDRMVDNQMQDIEDKVAADAVEQYEIAKRQGDKMQTYVQASMVTAAYLQAKDEPNYRKWKAIEKDAARKAGMPEM